MVKSEWVKVFRNFVNVADSLWKGVKINGKVVEVSDLEERKPLLLGVVPFFCFFSDLMGMWFEFCCFGYIRNPLCLFFDQ